jgi:predicted Rossmann fold nucleotide-binding protein DprA/Smf involved in DNA uptake
MAQEPLDRRISREIRERLKQSRAAVLEYERLEAALQALDKMDGATTATTGLRRGSNRRTQTRAPRGANREKALAAIGDQPVISIAQLSAATGITKNVLYGLTRTLTERGLIERMDGGDGAVGFRIAEPVEAARDAVVPADDGAAESEASED